MTVGMLGIRCLGSQLEAHQTDDIGGSIRKVVQCIGSDGDRAEQGTYHKLAQTEQDIAHHAHHTGQIAVGGADAGVLRRIGTAYKQTNQKLRHKSSFQAAHFQRTQCPSSIAFCFMVLKAFQKFHPITPDLKPGCSTKSPGGWPNPLSHRCAMPAPPRGELFAVAARFLIAPNALATSLEPWLSLRESWRGSA